MLVKWATESQTETLKISHLLEMKFYCHCIWRHEIATQCFGGFLFFFFVCLFVCLFGSLVVLFVFLFCFVLGGGGGGVQFAGNVNSFASDTGNTISADGMAIQLAGASAGMISIGMHTHCKLMTMTSKYWSKYWFNLDMRVNKLFIIPVGQMICVST